jgi:hypothetical protein
MTARAHVALRLIAVAWIAAMAYLPRSGAAVSKPAAATPAVTVPAAKHVHTLAPSSHTAALATR